jgi:hypothetical protein
MESLMSAYSTTRRIFLLQTGGLIATSRFARADQGDDQTLSAAEILERMAHAYAACTSYQDFGKVTTGAWFGSRGGRHHHHEHPRAGHCVGLVG